MRTFAGDGSGNCNGGSGFSMPGGMVQHDAGNPHPSTVGWLPRLRDRGLPALRTIARRTQGLITVSLTVTKCYSLIIVKTMKLSAWARRQGVHYHTALRWVTNNKMPVAFERTATGTILVKESVGESGNFLDLVALYARVSGAGQKSDLKAQLGRISVFAATKN